MGVTGLSHRCDRRIGSEVLLHGAPATVLDRGAPLDDAGDRGGPTLGRLLEGVSHERARCLSGLSNVRDTPDGWGILDDYWRSPKNRIVACSGVETANVDVPFSLAAARIDPAFMLDIALATLDSDPGVHPEAHICAASKAPWFTIAHNSRRCADLF